MIAYFFKLNDIIKHPFSLCAILLLAVGIRCDKNIVGPIDVPAGSRNYTWTVDTIRGLYTPFFTITGTSASDVWTSGPEQSDRIFYHFDGVRWTTDLVPRVFDPLGIYSISPTSVWSVGGQGRIWRYDGSRWKQQYQFMPSDSTQASFQDIYGPSESDLYAVGQEYSKSNFWGLIVHFDGVSWKRINIPQIRTVFGKIRRAPNGSFFVWGVTNEQFTESTYQFYIFDGHNLQQIHSGTQDNSQLGALLELGGNVYFIIGFDFFSYTSQGFTKTGRLSDLPEFLNVGFGRSTKDIFLGMRNGIAHYNGSDTKYLITTQENTFVRYGFVTQRDVFMMGINSNGDNLIFHAKLNE